MISIQTNINSIMLENNLNKTSKILQTSLEHLSTGCKINHASEDAATFTLSQTIKSQISGNQVAFDNVQHGVNLVAIADSTLGQMQNTAGRIRDLVLRAMNGTNSAQTRENIQAEIDKLTEELYREKNTAKYNDISIFGPPEHADSAEATLISGDGIVLQVGADSGEENTVTINTEFQLGNYKFDVSSREKASESLEKVDTLLKQLTNQRANCGATQNLLSDISASLSTRIINMQSSYSNIMDTDYASEIAKYTTNKILLEFNTALLAQTNTDSAIALSLLT